MVGGRQGKYQRHYLFAFWDAFGNAVRLGEGIPLVVEPEIPPADLIGVNGVEEPVVGVGWGEPMLVPEIPSPPMDVETECELSGEESLLPVGGSELLCVVEAALVDVGGGDDGLPSEVSVIDGLGGTVVTPPVVPLSLAR